MLEVSALRLVGLRSRVCASVKMARTSRVLGVRLAEIEQQALVVVELVQPFALRQLAPAIAFGSRSSCFVSSSILRNSRNVSSVTYSL